MSYKIKYIDNVRFMASSPSSLVDNITEGIHKIKCKDCDYFLEYERVKDNSIKYKYVSRNKDYSNKTDGKLKFSNNDINKFILLLRKGVYCYGYMDEWRMFNETSLPEKKKRISY